MPNYILTMVGGLIERFQNSASKSVSLQKKKKKTLSTAMLHIYFITRYYYSNNNNMDNKI